MSGIQRQLETSGDSEVDPQREIEDVMAEKLLYDDAPWIWGLHGLATEVTQPYVQGYVPSPVWNHDYTYAWLDVGPDGERVPR